MKIYVISDLLQRNHQDSEDKSDSDDDYVPYIPIKQRKKSEVTLLFIVSLTYLVDQTWRLTSLNIIFSSSKNRHNKKLITKIINRATYVEPLNL